MKSVCIESERHLIIMRKLIADKKEMTLAVRYPIPIIQSDRRHPLFQREQKRRATEWRRPIRDAYKFVVFLCCRCLCSRRGARRKNVKIENIFFNLFSVFWQRTNIFPRDWHRWGHIVRVQRLDTRRKGWKYLFDRGAEWCGLVFFFVFLFVLIRMTKGKR